MTVLLPKQKNHLLLVTVSLFTFFLTINYIGASQTTPELPTLSKNNYIWWDNSYSYRREVMNGFYQNTGINNTIIFNHASAAIMGKSDISAKDLKLIKYEDPSQTHKVEISILKPNEVETLILSHEPLDPLKKYYLYYGNNNEKETQNIISKQISQVIPLQLSEEETPQLFLKTFNAWFLKDYSAEINLITESIDFQNPEFEIINLETNKRKKINYEKTDITTYKLKLQDFEIGNYKIFLIADYNGEKQKSNATFLQISKPIFISWTIDWEGVNPEQKYLNKMGSISDKFNIPMTHFWNPRILINVKITKERKNSIVNWVKNRISKGDDIAMHLHMHHDMVEEAGLKPKYSAPTWDNGISGYDTPSTEYGYEEYKKILKWGLEKMRSVGFDNIQGFRAGGWFANLDNLRAIQDAGFLYDSSARVSFSIGKNQKSQPWKISNSTQPYYPNVEHQNISSPPNMRLLQIPNNGADSYWSSSEEMYENFLANYTPGELASESKLITYLSHPEWFDIEEPKLTDLFGRLQLYSYELDRGPIVFVTLRKWLEYFR